DRRRFRRLYCKPGCRANCARVHHKGHLGIPGTAGSCSRDSRLYCFRKSRPLSIITNPFEQPPRRLNPLTPAWVLGSPPPTERRWQGKEEQGAAHSAAAYNPECYLCPENTRAGGSRNPKYTSTFVFDNDFAALRPETPPGECNDSGLLLVEGERGICRVVCFSERHDLTLALMTRKEVSKVIDVWAEQYRELGTIPWIKHVQIFENRGAVMGASNPHPHCQIWANAHLPNQVEKEHQSQREYLEKHSRCLLCEYLALE